MSNKGQIVSKRMGWVSTLLLVVAITSGSNCEISIGTSTSKVLRVDAEFDPAASQDTTQPIRETNPAVAQTFTVLANGRFEEFWLVITDGESVDDGTIRITVRPLNAMGEPNADPRSSIIRAIDVDTSTLPGVLIDEFTEFSVRNDPGRDVRAGEEYAIVVDFVSRSTTTDTEAIARVLGLSDASGDSYPDGAGSTGESGVGFTNNTDDYFFRTFLLR